MPSETQVKRTTLDSVHAAFEELVFTAMDPNLPIAQRHALNNRAQELRTQWIELEAARFNTATENYRKKLAKVDEAVADLRAAIDSIDNAIRIIDKAGKLFSSVDKLLKAAASFALKVA